MGYPWFFVFVSLVATKTGSRPQYDFCVVGFVFLGFLVGFPICFPCLSSWLALLSPLLKQVSLDPVPCLPKSVVSYFWGCPFSQVLSILFKRVCLGSVHSALFVSSLWALVSKNSHHKLIFFVSVSSVQFVP